MDYVESNCVFEYQGQNFESGGAVVTDDRITAYLGEDGILVDWHGNSLGTYRMVAKWRTPNSYVSGWMMQVEAVINGITYTGRSACVGMVYNGKRKARQ